MKPKIRAVLIWSAIGGLALIVIINFIFNHAATSSASPTNVSTLKGDTNKEQQKELQKRKTPLPITVTEQGNVALPLGKLIDNIPTKDNKTVYLTFDDGPGVYTKEIDSILHQNGAHGSFFWIEDQVTNDLGQFGHQMLQQGDVIGSHTMHHDALGKESAEQQQQDLTKSADLIGKKIGQKIVYMRPPYGSVNKYTKVVTKGIGEYIIFWQVDSLDWSLSHKPEKILSNIEHEGVKPGSIILMHERKQTVKMLPQVIQYLHSKGYNMAALPASPNPKNEKR
ncbi:polysaccharide deacetylase family protein [Aneurinibacillus sp. Ricciae_BoGa-3]|uniref:polysaccharide deacetylase family protein n=1 Tax=Aneurinibacillus sp. Ricciae_BoGa-3 TaxID=3022697 RepID=UPI00234030E3|nr:polysaccharide deacetylase family protein [Aneurinibacillus sp. Ricciae_BoGa-3]WCK52921.1 polysaccharide deacetylase family protein [Aneurinibacillus sp. Ricciae_BoGa-3]